MKKLAVPLILLFTFLLVAWVRQYSADYNAAVLREWAANRTPFLTALAIGFAELGDRVGVTVMTILACGFLTLRKRRREALVLAGVMIVGSCLNVLLKNCFENPRPVGFESPYPALSYSYPSGHAQAAVALYGSLVMLYPRWFVVVPCLILATGILWCRLYLGVHWPTDVLAGGLVGAFVVSLGVRMRTEGTSRTC